MPERLSNPDELTGAKDAKRVVIPPSAEQIKQLQTQIAGVFRAGEDALAKWERLVRGSEDSLKRGEIPSPNVVRSMLTSIVGEGKLSPATNQLVYGSLINSFFATMQCWLTTVEERDPSDYRPVVLASFNEKWKKVVAENDVPVSVYSSFLSELTEISNQYPNFLNTGEQTGATVLDVQHMLEASLGKPALEKRVQAFHLAVSALRDRTERLRRLTPTTLQEFVGQTDIKARIEIAASASRVRKEPVPHLLLEGRPGIGKRTLAEVIALVVGANFLRVDKRAIRTGSDLVGVLTRLELGGVLFIEDIERLPDIAIEYLVPALELFALDITLDAGTHARTITMPIPPFTLIGTTTRSDRLTDSLLACFRVTGRFADYSVEELVSIARRLAVGCGLDLNQEAFGELARRSGGTPRGLLNALRALKDYALVRSVSLPLAAEVVFAALRTSTATINAQDRLVIPSSVRREVWRRDEGKCVKCGSREKLEYDHIIPVSKGGSYTARNIELLCESCNRAKSGSIQ
jgi:Holliday junction resolvasome RuvABC ATP-dependent DNA helicase subunit